MLALANDLRTKISDLLEVDHSDRIILTPGILVALRILFAHLRIERILLTSEEYYDEDHFPEQTVRIARCEAISELVLQGDCAAVIASPASWRGTRQPVAEQFASIRKALGREAPLLVADYAHAGSIGFPSVDALSADVICGDLEKWILRRHPSNAPPGCRCPSRSCLRASRRSTRLPPNSRLHPSSPGGRGARPVQGRPLNRWRRSC